MATAGTDARIDTKLFISTADTCAAIAKEIDGCFQEWAKVMQGLRGSWQGETSDDLKGIVDSVLRSREELLRSLANYKGVLYEMAGIYDKTEKNIQETSKSLKFDRAMR
ncbi:MAG: hypothetical protein LBJ61_02120 [Deltaproteobacteria bacterium]|jgi:uncharacterized protein YukE|nr:hypothetical protein [Deltaproteobacteria bacterium]